MNYSSYSGCGCGHPNAHPPCNYCTNTFKCDLCGDIYDVEYCSEETKAGFLCEDCYEAHEKIERQLAQLAARQKKADLLGKIAAYIMALPALLLIIPLLVLATLLLFAFIFIYLLCIAIVHPREEIFKIENDVQHIKTTFYLFVFIPFYSYTWFKQHSERNP